MASFSTTAQGDELALMPYPDSEVIQLREWGTDQIWPLPDPPVERVVIGRAAGCALRLAGPHVLPQHAELFHDDREWRIRGLGSAARLAQDGQPRREFVLTPGVEIGVGTTALVGPGVEVGIGTTTLVAESPRLIALRAFCARLLGWGVDRMRAVDHALRAIRLAAAHRTALVLQGKGDLVPIAYALHRRVLGDRAPFLVCDPRRRRSSGSVRSPPNRESCIAAFEAAAGGSLCVRGRRLPRDFPQVVPLLHAPDSRVQLIVCLDRTRAETFASGPLPIELPPLGLRELELPRIVEAYAQDAIAALNAPPGCFTEDDREWVLAHAIRSLPEIEKATLRVVALTAAKTVHRAAGRLGMAPVSLVRWRRRRGSP